jgi:hypothetical protein
MSAEEADPLFHNPHIQALMELEQTLSVEKAANGRI